MGDRSDYVVLDHGTGAKLSSELVTMIAQTLGDSYVGEMEDSAVLPISTDRICMTTDSFVIEPAFFGNGNIGKISVCGTVNDLAVMGSRPLHITLGLIIEVGFSLARLQDILISIRETAEEAGVTIVAGDTKIVAEGEADGIFINTTGIGLLERRPLRMRDVRDGDAVILSGTIGNHTVHLLSIREGLGFESRVLSDCAPLNGMIENVLTAGSPGAIHSIRDVTRGGLSAVLHEYARTLGARIEITEEAIPVQAETRMASDMLGINPLHTANEGCVCLFVDPGEVDATLKALRSHAYGQNATAIGHVRFCERTGVRLLDGSGNGSWLEELEGAELPRLC